MNKNFGVKEKIPVFARSFLIQAGWNYLKFQNIGFLFVVYPRLKALYGNGEKLKTALLRNFEIFNTQPYLASFVIGNVIKMEEAAMENPELEKNLTGLRQSLACAYASIGDRLFWARLRIAVFLSTAIIFIIGINPSSFAGVINLAFIALLAPTAVYAAVSVYFRWVGLERGYACGGEKACGLDFVNWNRLIELSSLLAYALVIFTGLVFLFLTGYYLYGAGWEKFIKTAFFIVFSVLAQRFFRSKKKNLSYTVAAILGTAFLVNVF